MPLTFLQLGRLAGIVNACPWLLALAEALLRGRSKPTEVLVTAVLMPHAARVAQMTGLTEAQVAAVYAATGERIG